MTYRRERKGPSTQPWGTPYETTDLLDGLLSITVFCVLSCKLDLNQALIHPPKTVKVQFMNKNTVINCIKSFFQVNENTKRKGPCIHIWLNSNENVKYRLFRQMPLSKAVVVGGIWVAGRQD